MILCFNSGSSTTSLNASQVADLNFSVFPTGKIEKIQNTWRSWRRVGGSLGPSDIKKCSEGVPDSTFIGGFLMLYSKYNRTHASEQ